MGRPGTEGGQHLRGELAILQQVARAQNGALARQAQTAGPPRQLEKGALAQLFFHRWISQPPTQLKAVGAPNLPACVHSPTNSLAPSDSLRINVTPFLARQKLRSLVFSQAQQCHLEMLGHDAHSHAPSEKTEHVAAGSAGSCSNCRYRQVTTNSRVQVVRGTSLIDERARCGYNRS